MEVFPLPSGPWQRAHLDAKMALPEFCATARAANESRRRTSIRMRFTYSTLRVYLPSTAINHTGELWLFKLDTRVDVAHGNWAPSHRTPLDRAHLPATLATCADSLLMRTISG